LTAPRFLVDENLSVKLPEVTHRCGFEATHVVHLGFGEWKDWNILEVVEEHGWVLVTNNAVEFRSRYRAVKIHPGVIFLLPSVRREQQLMHHRGRGNMWRTWRTTSAPQKADK